MSVIPPQPGSMSEIFTKIRVEVFSPESGLRWAAHVVVPKTALDDERMLIDYSLHQAARIYEANVSPDS